ncbi:STN domain-containing protein [Lacipirellula limnantheis]|uniref:Uncharacterized protein n=1 Tax=Lacipirellula limnantheis TaxID=2528024 RepID=A0A517TSS1_9BACT|nr:STN domain-containing protein [Lacipirellula limnantheis]QDT71413.1 hypothetical protein I41_05700 [Lacipirellula limnantheis]
MGQKMWGYCYALAVLTSIALAAPLPAADDTAGESSSSGQTRASMQAAAERRIEAALDSPLKAPLEFIATPLNQVTQVLSEDYDLPIVIDVAALDAVASSPEVEVNSSIGNVTLRSALDLMLRNTGEGDLTYIIDKEVLMITTQEEAEKRLQILVYRVDDLIDSDRFATTAERDAGVDQLNEVIVATVEHESWMENGTGEGEIQFFTPGMMVISQTRRVHDQVEDLLQRLRTAKAEVDADAAGRQATAATQPVTRSIAISDQAVADCEKTRNMIRQALEKSVNWQRELPEGDSSEVFLYVLPNRVLVRHVPDMVRQVERVVHEITPTPGGSGCGINEPSQGKSPDHPTPASADSKATAAAPDLADAPAASEDDN